MHTHRGVEFYLQRPAGTPHPKKVIVLWPESRQVNPWGQKMHSKNPARCLGPTRWENLFWIVVVKYPDNVTTNTLGRKLHTWEERLSFGPRLLARALRAAECCPVHIGFQVTHS